MNIQLSIPASRPINRYHNSRLAYRAAHIEQETAKQKAYKKAKRKECTEMQKLWLRTIEGKISNTYSQMQMRVQGKTTRQEYAGLPICTKEEFYSWALSDGMFLSLFAAWEAAGYPRFLTPSIDRIINDKGYALANCQWLTLSDNSKKSQAERQTSKAAQ